MQVSATGPRRSALRSPWPGLPRGLLAILWVLLVAAAGLDGDTVAKTAPLERPPSLTVDGLVVGTRWVRKTGQAGEPSRSYWLGDSLDITALGVEPRSTATPQEFQALVDARMRDLLARQGLVALALVVQLKLKVELFEMTLPAKRADAHAIHSYAGPVQMKGRLKTIPSYVPADRFLNLNAGESRCWVARTRFKKGNVLTTQYQVGPDHCFQPGEVVSFRIQSKVWRFRTPVWVVSEAEQEAFQRLYAEGKCKEGFLVKDTLNTGDRFVLMPCFDRAATRRPDWRLIRERELVSDIVEDGSSSAAGETQRDPDCGYITRKLVRDFALDKPDADGNPKELKVVHVDCHWLNIRLAVPAFIGVPSRAAHDVAAPPPPGLALQDVNHYRGDAQKRDRLRRH
ncbi:unnamed protein product [Prorocentrum cordatum]|uniref:Uncharacterized protein n=1 Tax=Prorocentrum cordatum TaxID=2364126 RepID=A0ABN9RCZ1_9DINO|nr:unnamed protein product [Polarella glacialis]